MFPGPIVAAAFVRLAAWAIIPSTRFASDEQGYVDAGVALATTGQQDLFWPPLTGWIVALVTTIVPADPLAACRLLWIGLDIANVALIGILAARIGRAAVPAVADRVARLATYGYALYLPAVSHAQFVTSEIPALLLVLASLVLVTSPPKAALDLSAGAALGALILARANLLPLLVMMPAAAFAHARGSEWARRTIIVVAAGSMVVGAALARNWIVYGEPTLSRNAAYNLYIGNHDVYAEDLDLLRPRATAEQIEFRRQFFAGTLQYPSGTASELQRAALQWIAAHPGQFLRRATGRLARVFAPKTDVLELAGGEAAVGVFSPAALTLLGVANLQWTWALFGGLLGLAIVWDRDRGLGMTLIATIAGSVALCLIAIAKPRYSFVFDPLLIAGAAITTLSAGDERSAAFRRHRGVLTAATAFLVWGWIAWTIFAVSSRLG